MGAYNLAYETISYFLDHVSISLDKTIANYDNMVILGDLNSTISYSFFFVNDRVAGGRVQVLRKRWRLEREV